MICRFNLAIEPAALPRPRHALRGKFVSSYYSKKTEQKFNEYTKAIKGAFNALSVVERENNFYFFYHYCCQVLLNGL
jgi:hypothetical protein